MKNLLLASFMTRALLSACITAIFSIVVATTAVFVAKPEWSQAIATYDKYYTGGDQERCEALFSKTEILDKDPSCDRHPPAAQAIKNPNELLTSIKKEIEDRKDCIDRNAAIRQSNIQVLWNSGCPIIESRFGYGYSEYKAPTLLPPSHPGSLMEFALNDIHLSIEKLVILIPTIFVALLFSSTIAATILNESNLGWRRLIIVLSVILTPAPLLIFSHFEHASFIAAITLLLLGLIGAATILISSRKVIVWIGSGFNSQTQPVSVSNPIDQVPSYELGSLTEIARTLKVSTDTAIPSTANRGVIDEDRESLMNLPLAGAWRRFIARTIDLWIFTLPTAFVLFLFVGRDISEHQYLFGIVVLPFVLLFEAMFSALLGNSPGKALLAIRLTTVGGSRLTFSQYYQRGRELYVYGLALGIPFVSLFPLIKQYQNLKADRPASYDQGLYSVRVSDRRLWRKIIAGIALFALVSIPGCLSSISH